MSLQCNADLSLITFKWVENYSKPWPDFRTKHMCRNFAGLMEHIKSVQISDEVLWGGQLVHPVLGPIIGNETVGSSHFTLDDVKFLEEDGTYEKILS